jgi:hypothetical protein
VPPKKKKKNHQDDKVSNVDENFSKDIEMRFWKQTKTEMLEVT